VHTICVVSMILRQQCDLYCSAALELNSLKQCVDEAASISEAGCVHTICVVSMILRQQCDPYCSAELELSSLKQFLDEAVSISEVACVCAYDLCCVYDITSAM